MENTSFTWKNKVVAITGGSRGIGKAIGLEAQSRGAKISVCDINENDLNNVSNEHGFLINNCDVFTSFNKHLRLILAAGLYLHDIFFLTGRQINKRSGS